MGHESTHTLRQRWFLSVYTVYCFMLKCPFLISLALISYLMPWKKVCGGCSLFSQVGGWDGTWFHSSTAAQTLAQNDQHEISVLISGIFWCHSCREGGSGNNMSMGATNPIPNKVSTCSPCQVLHNMFTQHVSLKMSPFSSLTSSVKMINKKRRNYRYNWMKRNNEYTRRKWLLSADKRLKGPIKASYLKVMKQSVAMGTLRLKSSVFQITSRILKHALCERATLSRDGPELGRNQCGGIQSTSINIGNARRQYRWLKDFKRCSASECCFSTITSVART